MTETLHSSFDTEPQPALDPEFLQGLDVLLEDPDERELAVHGVERPPIVHGETVVRAVGYESPYPDPDMPGDIQAIALVETEQGTYVGGGRVARFLPQGHDGSVSEQTMPYVSWTETTDGFGKQGRGTQRYEDMNGLALEHFGQVLHSDELAGTLPAAKAVWDKLVREGRAEEYAVDDGTRYRFKDR